MSRQSLLRTVLLFLFWSIIFSIAYTQYPLFSSNQNTYFLPGFACAKIGNLANDWQANTRDPAPLFSALVCLTLRLTHLKEIFYLYYGLILGIYFHSFYQILQYQVSLDTRARRTTALAGIFLLHAAGTRFVLHKLLGADWIYILEGGLANQRMLGSVFQPSVFGVFLLTSIAFAVQKRENLAAVCLALAAVFHPTYLLPSGMLLLTYMLLWINGTNIFLKDLPKAVKQMGRPLGIYLLLVFPIVVYVLRNFSGLPPELTKQAAIILIKYRIPHHADPYTWFNLTSIIQLVLIASAVLLSRKDKLSLILLLPALIGLGLTLFQLVTKNDSLALLFPWRISVVLVPLSISIWLARLIHLLPSQERVQSGITPAHPLTTWMIPSMAVVTITICLLVGWVRFSLDLKRFSAAPELPLYLYVQDHLQPKDVYLIPPKLENFRLSSGAAAYVDFKSSPYRADEVLEWYRRLSIVNEFYKNPTCDGLLSFQHEKITHLILPKISPLDCSFLTPQFETDRYRLYQFVPLFTNN